MKIYNYLIYSKMLFLSRKLGQSIVIDKEIVVTVTEIKSSGVRLSFSYPPGVEVLRKEVFDRIEQENKLAALSAPSDQDLEESLNSLIYPLKAE